MLRSIVKKHGMRLLLVLSLLSIQLNAKAENFGLAKAISYDVISIDESLAKTIIPLVRSYVSFNGHIAYIEGADYLVLGDNPKALKRLKAIIQAQSPENFNPEKFTQLLSTELTRLSTATPTIRTIQLTNLSPVALTAALSGVVSKHGKIAPSGETAVEISEYPQYVDELERMIKVLDSEQALL